MKILSKRYKVIYSNFDWEREHEHGNRYYKAESIFNSFDEALTFWYDKRKEKGLFEPRIERLITTKLSPNEQTQVDIIESNRKSI